MDICNKYAVENKQKNAQKLSHQKNRNRKAWVIQMKIKNMMNKSTNREE